MAIPLNDLLMGALTELRVHPSAKWIRASFSGETLVSSTRAVIVWEPRRLVSSYAVPAADVKAGLAASSGSVGDEHPVQVGAGGPPVLDPRTPFSVHLPGEGA